MRAPAESCRKARREKRQGCSQKFCKGFCIGFDKNMPRSKDEVGYCGASQLTIPFGRTRPASGLAFAEKARGVNRRGRRRPDKRNGGKPQARRRPYVGFMMARAKLQ